MKMASRQKKKQNQLASAPIHEEFIPWSHIIDCASPFSIDFSSVLEPGYLFLYEEYAGNGRHRSIEKTLHLRLHSLSVSVPTSLNAGQYFVVPPPANNDTGSHRDSWCQAIKDWVMGNLSWLGIQENTSKLIILSQLEKWTEEDMKQLSRIFYEFYDEIQMDGQIGHAKKRDVMWLGITEPGVKYIPELEQWIQRLEIPKMVEPNWKVCFQELEKQYTKIVSCDKILEKLFQKITNNHSGNRLIIFYDSVYVYLEISGHINRMQIRLQTTRKREFSWRQFWNEIQIMTYALLKSKKKGEIDPNRIIPWYLFAPNQISIVSKN